MFRNEKHFQKQKTEYKNQNKHLLTKTTKQLLHTFYKQRFGSRKIAT